MKERLSKYSNIFYSNKGCWDKEQTLKFTEGILSASSVNEDGKKGVGAGTEHITTIDVTTVDKVVDGQPVTFIKMDIEGSELKALMGAQETIKRNKPALAICVYHKLDDLITIPQYIKNLFPNACPYRFYLRHHSVSLAETVFYAVPKERF